MGVEHEACHNCKGFVQVSDRGAGFRRDATRIIYCQNCLREMMAREGDETAEDLIGRLGFNGGAYRDHRYVFFEDGTMLDLEHFFAAAETSLAIGWKGAMALGWGLEVAQAIEESVTDSTNDSGHPFGGNEDLHSNWAGAVYGWAVQSGNSSSGDVVDVLENLGHGAIRYATDEKPKK
jgi:hypothetical protein